MSTPVLDREALGRVASAADELAAAIRALLGTEDAAAHPPAAPTAAPDRVRWVSPTRSAGVPAFHGEAAFRQVFPSFIPDPDLVAPGAGGFPAQLEEAEVLRLLPGVMAGDVALEVATPQAGGDPSIIDQLLDESAGELRRVGTQTGVDLVDPFARALQRFPELEGRSAAWRS